MFNFRRDRRKVTSESELIELARKDSYYFGDLYDTYFDQIFRFVFKRLGGNEMIAGDLTQQTFLKAMANLHRYEDRGLPFSAWLYRIAQNEVTMYFRSLKNVHAVEVDENRLKEICSEAQINGYMTMEDQEKLITLLNEMEQDALDLIELRFFQSMGFKEIAAIYNITEANAKMRVYRILEKLLQKWNSHK